MFGHEPEPETEAGDFLEVMILLIEKQEQEHSLIEAPDPVEAIELCMEQRGLTAQDRVPAIGHS